jgi:hypothetical protein
MTPPPSVVSSSFDADSLRPRSPSRRRSGYAALLPSKAPHRPHSPFRGASCNHVRRRPRRVAMRLGHHVEAGGRADVIGLALQHGAAGELRVLLSCTKYVQGQ